MTDKPEVTSNNIDNEASWIIKLSKLIIVFSFVVAVVLLILIILGISYLIKFI